MTALRLLVLADLHIDKWLVHRRDPLDHLIPEDWASVDLCVLAGDLTDEAPKRWPRAFDWLGKRIALGRVHVFEGNHDYYETAFDDGGRHAEIAAAQGANYAQMGRIVLGRHRFLCCTLWTDFALTDDRPRAMADAQAWMNDYGSIRVARAGYRRLRPADKARRNAEHRGWLDRELAEPFDGETTVVTHHAPHPGALLDPQADVAPAYASDLTKMIERHRPARWIHGHTHVYHETTVGGTEIICASVGYPWQRSRGETEIVPRVIELPDPAGGTA
ncbi:metallophosphoesterase [Jannaschia aquimarina]|uniref:Calcineurin-like phosphoesterase superfamily domain protein n=1 Tax=Jannaschia aquimarina TaxID=935700 RepID=A0A0D1EI90_9RHOB|nr:metallophosphoesterase [Jannaschia aquimarina]KIT15570.1 Calcineurin-like phosphoesterase superfamily domain protein [Jannaschia aquimarina]SNT27092.1 Calcineurin-like phosphoesterase [Jannaschia aquimarina]